jgi:hypothetical protein
MNWTIEQIDPDPIQDAYFAGFFDGEGTVSIGKGKKSLYLLACCIGNTDIEPLKWCGRRYGGKLLGPHNRGHNHKPAFRWSVDARLGERFLRLIRPYTIIKSARIDLALEFRELFKGEWILPRGREKVSAANVAKRDRVMSLRHDYYLKMKQLNHRGTI